jgi:hypothetical protein
MSKYIVARINMTSIITSKTTISSSDVILICDVGLWYKYEQIVAKQTGKCLIVVLTHCLSISVNEGYID